MKTYANLSGDSGVRAFEINDGSITVEFNRATYLYTNEGVGVANIAEMQRRAIAGKGLSSFISQNKNVRNGYTRKWVN